MARILVLGGGVCGLAAGLDARPRRPRGLGCSSATRARCRTRPRAAWERLGARAASRTSSQAHGLQPRAAMSSTPSCPTSWRPRSTPAPRVGDPLDFMPPAIADRARRPGDERFRALHVRRPVLEQALARAADAAAGPHRPPRRGRRRAPHAGRNGSARVTGVRTDGGRGAARPTWSSTRWGAARGSRGCSRPPGSRRAPRSRRLGGFVYYTRFFRGAGRCCARRGSPRSGASRSLTLPADSGVLVGDALRRRRRPAAQAAARPRRLHRGRARLPAPRALARRRADHRRAADGRRDRPHRPAAAPAPGVRQRRRRLGVHEPDARPRHRHRA